MALPQKAAALPVTSCGQGPTSAMLKGWSVRSSSDGNLLDTEVSYHQRTVMPHTHDRRIDYSDGILHAEYNERISPPALP